ncbi:MAG: NAD(P)/FAD-dependent oxidoreductase [Bdellovibrionota bacterium]
MDLYRSANEVAIVGAGMSGLFSALLLADRGYQVTVIEKRPDPRTTNDFDGKSINFTLSFRGLNALKQVDLDSSAIQRAVEVKERIVHLNNGMLSRQTYGKIPGTGLYSISRKEMNIILLEAVNRRSNIQVVFATECIELDKTIPSLKILSREGTERVLTPEFIIGADGAFSIVRRNLQKGEFADYQQEYFSWVYKEVTLSKKQIDAISLQLDGVHVWPRHHSLLLGLPNLNGSLTCNLIVEREGKYSAKMLNNRNNLSSFLSGTFNEIEPHVGYMTDELLRKPWSGIMTMKTKPWRYQDKVVLVGDAAHTIVHFYAQGLNASLEDCVTLVKCLDDHSSDKNIAFDKYESVRKGNTDLLADLSKDNFITLSVRAASPYYEARTLIENKLTLYFPRSWQTFYGMIAHSSIPYMEAARISKVQDLFWRISGLPIIQLVLGSWIILRRFIESTKLWITRGIRQRVGLTERKT